MRGEETFANQWPPHQQGNVVNAKIIFCIRRQRPLGHRWLRPDTKRLIGSDGIFAGNGILAVGTCHDEKVIGISCQLDGEVHPCKKYKRSSKSL